MSKSPKPHFNPSSILANFITITITIFFIIFPKPLLSSSTPSFNPIDNYLINCGSLTPSTIDPFHRTFTTDQKSVHLSSTRTIPLTDSAPSGLASPLYKSTRIFTKPSFYSFKIKEKGAHLVRLHFYSFNSSRFDISNAQFHVLANGYLLMNEFSGLNVKGVLIREFVLWVDSDELFIYFSPLEKSKFGFVNAIEVVSAPKDLILDAAHVVDSNGVVRIDGMSKNGFETVYRVNVGGPKVTPFNDTLWRTWIPDGEFFESGVGSKEAHFSGRIKYQIGGASREVAPDNVYDSARVFSGSGLNVGKYKLSWVFRVADGYKYLVRTHFCDIVSPALGSLYFNVYVNGNLAYENLDLSTITNSLASPFYSDFVVNGGDNGMITVSVGPSNCSAPSGIDAILNGVEVFKMNNSMNSFDGLASAGLVLGRSRGGNGGFVVPIVAAIGMLVAASVILRKRFMAMRDSVPWSRLPMDVSEVDLKPGHR